MILYFFRILKLAASKHILSKIIRALMNCVLFFPI